MNRWVFFKIFALILTLVVVVYIARDLQVSGIDPALLGFTEEEINSVIIVCGAPPIAVDISVDNVDYKLKLEGTSWSGGNLTPEELQKFELGIESFCTQRKDKVVDISGLQRKMEFKENITVYLLDETQIELKMTDAGLIQLGKSHYLNAEFINAIEMVTE